MTPFKRILALTISLAVIIGATASGCSKPLTSEEIVAHAGTAYDTVSTAQMDMTMTMAMKVIGGKEPIDVNMNATATGSLNVKEKEMALKMIMDMEMPELGKQNLSTDLYIVDNWMYMGMTLPVVGEQWTKSKIDDTIWAGQNQLAQQIDLLKTAIEVKSLGEETIDGVECYVMEINPDVAALTDYIGSQLGEQGGLQNLEGVDLSKLFESMKIKQWISTRTYFPAKADMNIKLKMTPEDLGGSAAEFDEMTMDISIVVKYFGYNEPVTITLPEKAASAVEQSLK